MPQADAVNVNDAWVPSHCSMCYHGCPILAHQVDGVVTKIEGNPSCPSTQGAICPKGNAGIMKLYDQNRLLTPKKRSNPQKGLDIDPGWVDITWDEVKSILLEKLKRIRAENPAKLVIGGFNTHSWYWSVAFGAAFGTPNSFRQAFTSMGHMCGNGPHVAGGMIHNAMNSHPDIDYAKYMIIVGAAITEAYQGAVPYARKLGDVREDREMKLVVIDPQLSRGAAKAEEWIPIRPATDGAMLFGMIHVLVHEEGIYDTEYLQRYTNAGYLIGADGHPLRHAASGKPLVWDVAAACAKEYDDPNVQVGDVALLGEYDTPAGRGTPGFELFKRHVKQYTPEWAEKICTVPAATIRRIATEFGEAACIGQTIELDGQTYPYRPVSVAGYRGMGAHSNGLHTSWAAEMMNLLVGSVRAVGGLRAWDGALCVAVRDQLNAGKDGTVGYPFPEEPFSFPPKSLTLTEYFPASFTPGLVCFDAQLEPEKYAIETTAELVLFESGNPIMTAQNPERMIEAMRKIPYFVDITLYIDETALLADLVIPDVTYLERWAWEGSWLLDDEGLNIQRPVIEPLHGIKHSADLYIELAQELGFQTGPTGYSSLLNVFHGGGTANDINHPYKNAEEYVRAYVHNYAGGEEELIWRQGHNLKRVPPRKRYLPDCLGGLRFPFYQPWLLEVRDTLKQHMDEAKAWDKVVFKPETILYEYAAMPFWHESVIENEPPEFDMYVINWRTPIGAVCAGTFPASNAWLQEVADRDPYFGKILINTQTAHGKGLKDGELVCVESAHGSMTGILKCTQTIHPEVIGTMGAQGHVADANVGKGHGTGNFNCLLGSGFKYMGKSSLQTETTARAKIYRLQGQASKRGPFLPDRVMHA